MARTIDKIIADFQAFTFEDFNLGNEGSNGNEQLYALTQELLKTPRQELAMDAMFNMFERFPDPDAHQSLGTLQAHLCIRLKSLIIRQSLSNL